MSTLLYLHGFNSSPQSIKAQEMQAYLQQKRPDIQFICPQLAVTPADAWTQIATICEALVEADEPFGVAGSSLGGFLATRVAETYGVRAVVINPAVNPHWLLKDYLGEQLNPYTQQRYLLTEQHIQVLRELRVNTPSCMDRIWLLQQQGDEVLDYREALEYYRFARVCIQKGGDHSFIGFHHYCAQIIRFLQL
ncbi:YqiA/YcfP family alpha/beta fold hydrolase [Oceanisphaera avium]|uniref:Esterase YqiA n=1 Tax=Oceanisphaera avium TaxID=1903694 RepID=A0A1Y0CXU4_9GAMM|nr:YqiA/YcfP family alpha/beta fold hydrolase [Oceanisphaera avium]ART80140.1 esterase YqiA [Oceanisphaera avium]